MKTVNIAATAKPLALLVQIDPSLGTVIECAVHYKIDVSGNSFRHEEWWSAMSAAERKTLQKIVDSAIKGTT